MVKIYKYTHLAHSKSF